MKILLTGQSGQLGHELARSLPVVAEVVSLSRAELDLSDLDKVRDVVRRIAPDLIVNPAAYTAVDKAESDPELAIRINAEAPRIMAEEAQRLGAGIIHYSTDYVFDGTKDGTWKEDDATHPLSVYGSSKLAGEQAVAIACEAHWIVRTSWVYGVHGNNFLKTVLRLAREKDSVNIVADQTGAPTWARSIAAATMRMLRDECAPAALQKRMRDSAGIYHLSAAGSTSWHGYASFVVAQLQAQHVALRLAREAIAAIPTSDYPTPARRPLNSCLDLQKIANIFGVRPNDWQADVATCLREILSNSQ